MKAIEFAAKYKMWLIIIITVVIILAAVYYWGRKKGKEARKDDLPEDVTKGITDKESIAAADFADRINSDLKGINLWSHDMDLWNAFVNTTDRIIIATSNYFNQKYGNGESLYKWIKDESAYTIWGGGWTAADTWKTKRQLVMERMEKLKLN